MLRTLLLLNVGLLLLAFAVSLSSLDVSFSKIESVEVEGFNNSFPDYCRMDSSQNFEANAVLSSFFGDQQSSILFATQDATSEPLVSRVDMDGVDVPQMREYFTRVLSDTSLNEDDLLLAKKILYALETPSDPGEVFEEAAQHDARKLIVDSA